MNNKNTFPTLSIPKTVITNGAQARGGTGLYNSTIGSKNPLANLFSPINKPKGTPKIIQRVSPKNTLKKESQMCPVGTGILKASNSPVTISKTLLLKFGSTVPS